RDIRDALTSGEDFELLFTLPLARARRLRDRTGDFIAIGQIIPQKYGATLVDKRGRKRRIEAGGFRHF
ncbi:MAG: thiamine-phosphate kinase, partial [Candidatus Omnitrophica bacterium]|nr:thiamine-phosphate kinase [Candidatus Omnitrophota bacterium]